MQAPGRWVAVALLLVIVAGGTVVAMLLRTEQRTPTRRLDPSEARESAARACARLDEVLELVRTNAAADVVYDRLDEAKAAASEAAAADNGWIELSSGVSGLEVGLRKDNAEATEVALTVARTACGRLRASLP